MTWKKSSHIHPFVMCCGRNLNHRTNRLPCIRIDGVKHKSGCIKIPYLTLTMHFTCVEVMNSTLYSDTVVRILRLL